MTRGKTSFVLDWREQIEIALLLKHRTGLTVWIDAGKLYVREGLQGPRERLPWREAVKLSGYGLFTSEAAA